MKKLKEYHFPDNHRYCKKSCIDSSAWTMIWVYPKDGEPVIVKGHFSFRGMDLLLKEQFPESLYRYTFWKDGKSVGAWCFNFSGLYVKPPKPAPKLRTPVLGNLDGWEIDQHDYQMNEYHAEGYHSSKWTVIYYVNGKAHVVKRFKRMPHKWIPEFTEALKAYRCVVARK